MSKKNSISSSNSKTVQTDTGAGTDESDKVGDIETSIKKALDKHDFKTAKRIIDEVIDRPLTSIEKGKIYTDITTAYLRMTNEVQLAYSETLNTAITSLKQVEEDEKQMMEKIEQETVRKRLQEIDDLD